jgi:voltage-gated sodium channel
VARLSERCARIADSTRFQGFIVAVILANAIVLGLQTYEEIDRDAGELLVTLDGIFLGIFVVEILIRILACGPTLRGYGGFFRQGWNVFDFVVIGAAFLPGLRENATLLRLVRLLRVVRIVSVLPDLRVLLKGMVRSLLPIATMAVVGVLLLYVYGMVGWILFHEELPEQWGTIADSMLTLFVVMTLENFPQYMEDASQVHPQAWIFFVSYVLLASFLVINVLIAIIINSIEEARRDDALEAVLSGEATPPALR